MTRQSRTTGGLDRIRQHLHAALPGLDGLVLEEVLGEAGLRGAAVGILERHLAAHPDALTRPGTAEPFAMVRLAHALIDRGIPGVTAPACADCGKPSRQLGRQIEGRSLCPYCFSRAHYATCSRCVRPARRTTEQEDGPVCRSCTRAASMPRCATCGREVRKTGVVDGPPLCHRCRPRTARACVSCGTEAPVQAVTPDGPVCRRCYRSPTRTCGQCGQVRHIIKRARGGEPDLCSLCYRVPDRTCSGCGRTRPVAALLLGKPRCPTCHESRPRSCAVCGRSRKVQAEWPVGPVCGTCYTQVRRNPAPCGDCGQVRPLIGRRADGAACCGPCAGAGQAYECQGCGVSGLLFRRGFCARCVLDQRVTGLLAPPGAPTVPARLEPLRAALLAAGRPVTVHHWLDLDGVADLFNSLATRRSAITHRDLDALPDKLITAYVRDLLSTADVLPQRHEEVERLPRWADHVLAQAPAEHRKIVSPFAHCYVIRRHRDRTRRGQGFAASSLARTRSLIQRPLELLAWLDEEGLALADLNQHSLDRWLSQGKRHRRDIRVFLQWARRHKLTAHDFDVPRRRVEQPSVFLKDEERLQQLRRCVEDETLPLATRVVGSLVLLLGLQISRILRFTTGDVVREGKAVRLHLNGHQVDLPPRISALVGQRLELAEAAWQNNRSASTTPWLFPCSNPARPLSLQSMHIQLRKANLTGLAGRNTARLALATDVPASILAEVTGTSVHNAMRWATLAKRDWTDYIATRREPNA